MYREQGMNASNSKKVGVKVQNENKWVVLHYIPSEITLDNLALSTLTEVLKDDPYRLRNSFWIKCSHCHTGEKKVYRQWSYSNKSAFYLGLRTCVLSLLFLSKIDVLENRHEFWIMTLETTNKIRWLLSWRNLSVIACIMNISKPTNYTLSNEYDATFYRNIGTMHFLFFFHDFLSVFLWYSVVQTY